MYLNMEEMLLLLWRGSRAATEEVQTEECDGIKVAPVTFHVPHTAIFRDGRLENWYFSSKGYLRKKQKANLNKHALLNEFIRNAKPGHYIATLICMRRSDDGFFSTQRVLLEDPAFSKMVKAAFTTHFSGIFQQFVVGDVKQLAPWILDPPLDPRTEGMGVLECVWSPQHNTITLRSEAELSALSHYCLQGKGRDGRVREKSIKLIVHAGASVSNKAEELSGPARREEERRNRLREQQQGRKRKEARLQSATGAQTARELQRGAEADGSAWRTGSASVGFAKASGAMSARELHGSDVVTPQIGGTDFVKFGRGCVISLQERQEVLAACEHLARLLHKAVTDAGETPTLRSMLAHFKRGQTRAGNSGFMQLVWVSGIVTVPTELEEIRTLVVGETDYCGLQEVLQMCVLDTSVFYELAVLDQDKSSYTLKAHDKRALTMDLHEFLHFLKTLKVLPQRLTKEEACSLFRQANAAEGIADDDAREMNFWEFKHACKLLAGMLAIDWSPIEAAARFAEPLLKPRWFRRYSQGGHLHVGEGGHVDRAPGLLPAGTAVEAGERRRRMYYKNFEMLLDACQLLHSEVNIVLCVIVSHTHTHTHTYTHTRAGNPRRCPRRLPRGRVRV